MTYVETKQDNGFNGICNMLTFDISITAIVIKANTDAA